MPAIAQARLPIQLPAPSCPGIKHGASVSLLKRSLSSTVVRRPRRTSLLRLTPTKPSCSLPRLSPPNSPATPKKRLRLPLQTIHIRALEHGLRVPVPTTPLGTVDQAENIACLPLRLNAPMTASPTTTAFPRLDLPARPTRRAASATTSPATSPRPLRRPRRNSTGRLPSL
ncbi:hypothetical protein GGF46_000803 [Coemansia sp. RSA 552]|nr:hypothetical protein GGF46_000803 [Coemansia sp. RSA 552]